MIGTGLSAASQAAFEDGLCHDHMVTTTVRILTLDHDVVGQVTGGVLSGQVDVDSSQDVERTCTVEILDPGNQLGLDGDGPTAAPTYADRMVQITYDVKIPGMDWVRVPVFTGPITKADRAEDGTLTLTGSGKEVLLQQGLSRNVVYKSGTIKTRVIDNLAAIAGERFRAVTQWSAKTSADIVLAPKDPPWTVMQNLAHMLASRSAGTDPWLGYDGAGILRLKSHSAMTRWTFKAGESSALTAVPKLTFDTSTMKNFVVVTSSSNAKIQATATAPASHPLSPVRMGRGGVSRFIRDDVEADVSTKAAAQALATQTLDADLKAGVDVDFESLIIPHLEPRDVVVVASDTWEWPMQVTKFSIPLGASQAMTHSRHAQVRPRARMRATVRH